MHGFCGMNKSELYWKSPAYCITQSILKGIFPTQTKKVEGNQRFYHALCIAFFGFYKI